MTPNTRDRLADFMAWAVLGIFVLLPFHAFFTTWLGSNFGHIDVFRLWKELLIVLIAFGVAVLLARDKKLQNQIKSNFLIKIIVVYCVFTLLRSAYGYASGGVNLEAAASALVLNLRYLVFFCLVWVVAAKSEVLSRLWLVSVIGPATVVVIFGLLQQFVLDKSFLAHFGYGQNTILPYQAVDLKPDYARAQSTLRGPNPLGAYLVLLISVFTAGLYSDKKRRLMYGLLWIFACILLFYSFSRSAWIGLVVSQVVLTLLLVKRAKSRRAILLAIAAVIAAVGLLVLYNRDNNFVQNTVFHTDETSQSTESSNAARTNALLTNIQDAIKHPMGGGPGSAGPASFRNDQPAKISENYFVQIAQEVGLIGLLLYTIITLVVLRELWLRRADTLSAILLASFAGITAINMVSHAWTDDTLSLLWWGLAAVALASIPTASKNAILKANTHEKPKQSKASS